MPQQLQAGVIAQDVRPIFPEAITKASDGYLLLDDKPIEYAMLNAIKDLNKENDTLKDENTQLKEKVSKLEEKMKEKTSDFEKRMEKVEKINHIENRSRVKHGMTIEGLWARFIFMAKRVVSSLRQYRCGIAGLE